MPRPSASSSTSASMSRVEPTQVRCDIASMPNSRRRRLTMRRVRVARAAAGPVGDRDERRLELLQGRHGVAEQRLLGLVGLGREELEGDGRLGLSVQGGNAHCEFTPLRGKAYREIVVEWPRFAKRASRSLAARATPAPPSRRRVAAAAGPLRRSRRPAPRCGASARLAGRQQANQLAAAGLLLDLEAAATELIQPAMNLGPIELAFRLPRRGRAVPGWA